MTIRIFPEFPITCLALCLVVCLGDLRVSASEPVTLESRLFAVGETPPTALDERPFIDPGRIPWLRELKAADPILDRVVFHIETAYVPLARNLELIKKRNVDLPTSNIETHFVIPGFRMSAVKADLPFAWTYLPLEEGAGYFVNCGLNTERTRFGLCVVFSIYDPDPLVRLKARLYIVEPEELSPELFPDVVRRMREFASCLDVTDLANASLVSRADIAACIKDGS